MKNIVLPVCILQLNSLHKSNSYDLRRQAYQRGYIYICLESDTFLKCEILGGKNQVIFSRQIRFCHSYMQD